MEKVYLLKLQNGELDQHTYGDVMTAVDDIMTPINEDLSSDHLQNIQKTWSQEMKDIYLQVYHDFKNGALQWSDISVSYIQQLGAKIIDKVMHSAEDYYKSIKSTIFKEVSSDLISLSKQVNLAEDFLSQVFRSIIGKP